jgi:lysozyme
MSGLIALATKLIRENEGLRLFAYDCGNGRPVVPGSTIQGHVTVGYGRALDVKGITKAEADHLFLNDLADAEEYARTYAGESLWQELNDPRRVALMDMAHNLGPTGLRGFVRMREAIACSAWDAAAEELLDSTYARQVPARAARNAEMLRTGRVAG